MSIWANTSLSKGAGDEKGLPPMLSEQRESFTLLQMTKFHLPLPRARLVPRTHLTARLQQGMEGPLILISAPAGFGKTTLLAHWLRQGDTPVAWLSLEVEDNDPTRFLIYLIAALQTVEAQLGTIALALLRTSQPPSPETVLALLANDLASRAAGELILVLDDYHVITAEPIHRAMGSFLEHMPPQLHFVIATRSDPPLALSRLRARGHLTELRAADLRFETSETVTFLTSVMELDLLPESIATLQRRTEGWITGLQLAALSLRGRTDVTGFLATFAGSHRFVLDYLSEEVISQQDASVQQFLLHTCHLERLSGPLCNAVTGQEQSQEMLERLDRLNLFVISLDDERQWYRYHHLFAEVLRKRLQQTEPTLVPVLHDRASLWYEQQGLVIEAVQHALAAHDLDRSANLIESWGITIAHRGQIHLVLNWLGMLPRPLVEARPKLSLLQASLLMFTYQFEEVLQYLNHVEQALHYDSDAHQTQIIRGQLAVHRGNIDLFIGDLSSCVSHAHEALALLPDSERVWRVAASIQASTSYLVEGDVPPTVQQTVERIVASMRTSSSLFSTLGSVSLLVRLYMLQGKLHQAAIAFDLVMHDTPEEEELRRHLGDPAYSVCMGELLREWNKLDEALRTLKEGLDRLHWADLISQGYMTLARVQWARGDEEEARAALYNFERIARHRQFAPHLLALGAALRAELALTKGDLTAAVSWAETSGLAIHDELSFPREQEYLTLARVRIAQGRENPVGSFLNDALQLLDRLLADAEAKARMGSTLEILILQALACSAQNDRQRALTSLQRALLLAEPEGYIRLFVDEGMAMLTLLRQAQARGFAPNYVATLLLAFGESAQTPVSYPSATHSGSLIEPLTEREREVLQLLATGASNGEIAHRLVVSVGTVKKHVYNICGKLGVQSRTHAIVRARTLHLL